MLWQTPHTDGLKKEKRLGGAVIKKILLENYTEAEEHKNAGKLLKKKMKTFNREEDAKKRRDKIYPVPILARIQ